jgi:peptidase A4-like protein
MRKTCISLAVATLAIVAGPGARITPAAVAPHVGLISGAHAGLNITQSNNWSGYNKSILETKSGFTEVSGTWTVPTATQARSGQAEFSATWVGIGGGCVNPNCTVVDQTLIQAGTEQDVDSSGRASYSAWWELIPAPSTTISMAVSPGNRIHVDVKQTLPELWSIVIENLSTGALFTKTTPYTSTHATAEWILETPLLIGVGGTGLSAMPNLSSMVFDPGTLNGKNPGLLSTERIQLVSGSGQVLATPSLPDSDRDGFADCTYATSCGTNGS